MWQRLSRAVRTGQLRVMSMRPLARPSLDSLDLSTASVVIVDDVPANVALLQRMIRSLGVAQVHGVTDARLAVEACLGLSPDVVLLDLQMPHVDGLAVMAELRAALPADHFLPVLVLTADTSQATREQALAAGANDFLAKPFERTEVLLRVTNLLQTRQLYVQVQQHNAELRAELAQRTAQEQRIMAEHQAAADRIDGALAEGLPHMVFQPIIDLVTRASVGVEGLARFPLEPVRPPNEWFDDAAGVGRGLDLELAAIAAAVRQLPHVTPTDFLALNVSPATALSPRFAQLLSAVPGDRLVIELTEHARVPDYSALAVALSPLRERGVRIAVDDAGAGYAGLQHLLRIRPEIIKLDIALTRGIDDDPARRALARTLQAFAEEIGACVVAEGIETATELQALSKLGIRWGQGYHLARPAAIGESALA